MITEPLSRWDVNRLIKKYKEKRDLVRRYKRALGEIANHPDCICGSLNPDEWNYQLVGDRQPCHVANCNSVIAAKALGLDTSPRLV